VYILAAHSTRSPTNAFLNILSAFAGNPLNTNISFLLHIFLPQITFTAGYVMRASTGHLDGNANIAAHAYIVLSDAAIAHPCGYACVGCACVRVCVCARVQREWPLVNEGKSSKNSRTGEISEIPTLGIEWTAARQEEAGQTN